LPSVTGRALSVGEAGGTLQAVDRLVADRATPERSPTALVPCTHFDSATGALESQPHNQVHVAAGGQSDPSAPEDNLGWMANPNLAARDPIFWLHHSNTDRLWEQWKRDGHADAPDQRWRDQTFPLVDASPVRMRIGDIVTPGSPGSIMDHRYDDQPESPDEGVPEAIRAAAPGGESQPPRELAWAGPVELWAEPTSVHMEASSTPDRSWSPTASSQRLELALGDLEGHGGASYGEASGARLVRGWSEWCPRSR
jgi:hypothetical protein